jgi:glycerophosphoryl diester phosphodiesterase
MHAVSSFSSPSTGATSRREFLAACAAAPLLLSGAAAAPSVFLIAHRGGVVDASHPENSPSSIDAAIADGYWMIEADIRRTRDGQAVMQHDATFDRFYGVSRKVDEMTWDEVKALRATPGGTRPLTFDEVCERCTGRMRLMLDIKGDAHPVEFYQGLIDSLRRHKLLDTTYSLSGGRVPELSGGIVSRACDRKALAAAIARGEAVSRSCHLFELGSVLDEAAMELCRAHNVTPVAALNTFRYQQAGVDHLTGARADAERLRALGVKHFQIDSIYAQFFRD